MSGARALATQYMTRERPMKKLRRAVVEVSAINAVCAAVMTLKPPPTPVSAAERKINSGRRSCGKSTEGDMSIL